MQEIYTLRTFNKLGILDQYGLLRLYGVHLGVKVIRQGYHVSLFSLYNYYVEVWSKEKEGKLVRLQAFSSYKRLDPFLKRIDLTLIYCLI